MAEYSPRINTSSRKVACFTRRYLARRFDYPFDLAISTRNYLILDFDCVDRKEAWEEAKMLGEVLVSQYGSQADIWRSPHGYHLVFKKWMTWKEIRRHISMLLEGIKQGVFTCLDQAHLEASLRRGYMTLRLNQRYKVAEIRLMEGGAKTYVIREP